MTIGGALPVTRKSPIDLLLDKVPSPFSENLLTGWRAKIFALVLIGFAATHFVITMTLSAAETQSAMPLKSDPRPLVGTDHGLLTVALLIFSASLFVIGFREAIRLATAVAVP